MNYPAGFRILGEVGRGAVGAVYKAERRGGIVALKVLSDSWARQPGAAERFVEEGRLMSRLDHPGIVKVLDAGRDGEIHYLVLEFVEGPSFARVIARRAFTPHDSAAILSAVARALHHAHRRGIVHTDIVPGNILLKSDGSPKLGDFGIARVRGLASGGWKAGETAGTPVYMSPEQAAAMNDVVDVRSDIYSLGVVLYEALTGRVPFSGRSTAEILERVVRETPPPPRALEPSISPALEKVVLRSMDKDPARRYPSAMEFGDALDGWARLEPDPLGR